MTASALAGELGLPLLVVQLHGLITKFMGETAAKLRMIFDAMDQTRGVYLFDEFDAIGGNRDQSNDVGEIRRVLNSFLQFLEQEQSDSFVIAATNHSAMLDRALYRRFDDCIRYSHPNAALSKELIENRLAVFGASQLNWKKVRAGAKGLSYAEIARACDDAARSAVLDDKQGVDSDALVQALRERRCFHPSS
jgi:SpoVK/Ycf46/Vps4 family AAA+-type ATPase